MRAISLSAVALAALLSLGGPVKEPSIGCVDVQKVITDSKLTQEIMVALEKKLQAHRNSIRQDEEALKERIRSIDSLELENDPLKLLQLQKEIKLAQVDLEIKKTTIQFEREQNLVNHVKKVYKTIVSTVETIARKKGIHAVFLLRAGDIEGMSKAEVMGNIALTGLVWADPAIDLTNDVIQLMNK